MNIHIILKLKFPAASFLEDIKLQDDGDGPYIKEWNISDIPEPTQKELDQWAIELQPQLEAQQVVIKYNIDNKETLEQLETIDLKSIRAMREGDAARIAELNSQAVVLRGKLV